MLDKKTPNLIKRCSNCNNTFICTSNSDGLCWCNAYPIIIPLDLQQDCQCSECLGKKIGLKLDDFIKSKPLHVAIEEAGKYKIGDELIKHIDFTIEKGNYVFSKWYLLKRGFCCGNDCRNCPY